MTVYIDDLYYTDTEKKADFSFKPEGVLIFDRFVRGQPCWYKQGTKKKLKPKSIVINDWRLIYAPYCCLNDKEKQTIVELIENGFSVHIVRADGLVKVDINTINELDIHWLEGSDSPKSYSSDEEFASLLGIEKDHMLVLDLNALNAVKGKNDSSPVFIYMSALARMTETETDLEQDSTFKKNVSSAFAVVVNDEYPAAVDAEKIKELMKLKSCAEFDQTKILRFGKGMIASLFYDGVTIRRQLVGKDKWEAVAGPQDIEHLIVDHVCEDPSMITTLISKLENLKTVTINCRCEVNEIAACLAKKEQLISLKIGNLYNKVTVDEMAKILENAQHLKKITLHLSAEDSASENTQQEFKLNNLVSLSLTAESIYNETLNKIFRQAKSLKSLALRFTGEINIDVENMRSLDTIENLSLTGYMNVYEFMMRCPNITSASIKSLNLKLMTDADARTLEHLTKLDCRINRASNRMSILMRKMPNLRALTVGFDRNEKITLGASDKLEELNISSFDLLNLKDILGIYPNLKNLILEKFVSEIDDNKKYEIGNISLPINLEYCSLDGAYFSDISFFENLTAIKKLKLVNADLNAIDFHLCVNKMAYLCDLEIVSCDINDQALMALIKLVPNLKTLKVSNCDNLSEAFFMSVAQQYPDIKVERLTLGVAQAQGSAVAAEQSNAQRPVDNVINSALHRRPRRDDTSEISDETFSQGMIIMQLINYFRLKQTNLDLIPLIKDGICEALTKMYENYSTQEWIDILKMIRGWNGKSMPQPKLEAKLLEITSYVQHRYMDKPSNPKAYAGDNLASLFENLAAGTYTLYNSWHAISVKYENGTWYLYDPNMAGTNYEPHDISELVAKVHQCLGVNVLIGPELYKHPFTMSNPDKFIEYGGIFILKYAYNSNEVLARLRVTEISEDCLYGLLLRDLEGEPAWFAGLSSLDNDLAAYTRKLFMHYIESDDEYIKKITYSLDALKPFALHNAIECLIRMNVNTPSAKVSKLIDHLCEVNANRQLDNTFKECEGGVLNEYNIKLLCEKITNNDVSKRLVNLNSNKETSSLALNLLSYCKSTSKPIFYIDSPDQLVCQIPAIAMRGDNSGVLRPGPGGPLYDFLEANRARNTQSILLINYDKFSKNDMARLHSLLEQRKIDGIPLPANMSLIGLINSNSKSISDSFNTQFDDITSTVLKGDELTCAEAKVPIQSQPAAASSDNYSIDFYNQSYWESTLLGQWSINGDELRYQEGELAKAIASGKPTVMRNMPLNDPAFTLFWQKASIDGYVELPTGKLKLPASFSFSVVSGYDWSKKTRNVAIDNEVNPAFPVLNSQSLNQFLKEYKVDNKQHKLNTLPGIVEKHQNSDLHVNLTGAMSDDQWAMLLDECNKHHVGLHVHPYQGAKLPSFLSALANKPISLTLQRDQVLVTNDVDAMIHGLQKTENSAAIINVTELNPSDLLTSVSCKVADDASMSFTETTKALLLALEKKQTIILHGSCSDELADALTSLMYKRSQDREATGKIIFVAPDATLFQCINQQQHTISVNDKLAILSEMGYAPNVIDEIKPYCELEPLCYLVARCIYRKLNAAGSTEDAWVGMYDLTAKVDLQTFDPADYEQEAKRFVEDRIRRVMAVLNESPIAYLTGLTATGKTTFTETDLKTFANVYHGESNVLSWIEDDSDEMKILVIDEANIAEGFTQRQWLEFEGLFRTPRTILIDGVLHPLSPKHKVIFAGNPVGYSADRHLPQLFDRHGSAVLFEPLSTAFIYEKMLKPVLHHDVNFEISKEILCAYKFICDRAVDEILISPRELQMIALLIENYLRLAGNKNLQVDTAAVTRHYIRQVCGSLITTKMQKEFDQQFPVSLPIAAIHQQRLTTSMHYIPTPSRETATTQLFDLLSLRDFRQSELAENKAERYGGLGGFMLEAESGEGKTTLVKQLLHMNGYQFHDIPINLSIEEKKNRLMQAFREGEIVVIDDIFAAPALERLMNDLLMGKAPDGSRPKPGFMLIALTKPSDNLASPALARRMLQASLPPYTQDERAMILRGKGVKPEIAQQVVNKFESLRARAIQDRKKPPTFHVVDKVCEKMKANVKILSMLDRDTYRTLQTARATVTSATSVGSSAFGQFATTNRARLSKKPVNDPHLPSLAQTGGKRK